VGQKTSALSLAVSLPNDQPSLDIAIQAGLITNYSAIIFTAHNIDVTTTLRTVADVAVNASFLGSASFIQLSSVNGADAGAGTGARTVLVTGLDANFDEITETIQWQGLWHLLLHHRYFLELIN